MDGGGVPGELDGIATVEAFKECCDVTRDFYIKII